MKLILYNLVKPLRAFELWVMVIGYILYVLCLLYFSSFFDSQIERIINLKDNQIYYQNQSSYFIWVMLGVVIVIKSHHIIMANELNLWVILKSKYLYAKFIVYYIELFIVFVIVYGT